LSLLKKTLLLVCLPYVYTESKRSRNVYVILVLGMITEQECQSGLLPVFEGTY